MEDAIINFNKQFSFDPEIINGGNLLERENFIVCGMGGSHLSAGILNTAFPFLNLRIHQDYGLPPFGKGVLEKSTLIASSYSGNTEEVLSFAKTAIENKYNLVCIASGGKLIEMARENNVPYILLPNNGIQPRTALGFSIIAIAKILGDEDFLHELSILEGKIRPLDLRKRGSELAESLRGKVPVVYASSQNQSIAYNWKIKFNETGKIPAFFNVFPELNHNEMTGFDVVNSTKDLSKNFHFIFITSKEDHPQVLKRMEVCEKLYQERGLSVTKLWLEGETRLERIFNSLILADWTALFGAWNNKVEPDKVPMVEEFKRLIIG